MDALLTTVVNSILIERKVIRQFQLAQIWDEKSETASFQKLSDLVDQGPSSGRKKVKALYYKDSAGDVIAIATDMELNHAISSLHGSEGGQLTLFSPQRSSPELKFVSRVCSDVGKFLLLSCQLFLFFLLHIFDAFMGKRDCILSSITNFLKDIWGWLAGLIKVILVVLGVYGLCKLYVLLVLAA